ncbi:ARM repeat-containing protein [Agrocybe pediades]|nr:ARM repeat-containing protein [Agrocybe pediades]
MLQTNALLSPSLPSASLVAADANRKVHLDSRTIGQKFIEHLVQEGDYVRAAQLCPKVCGRDGAKWEHWIFTYAERKQLHMLLKTIKEWPQEIYDVSAVIVAVKAELDNSASTSSTIIWRRLNYSYRIYTANRQYGKALPYYLRLRRPNVFDLIRDNHLFTDVQDQVLLLIEFDHELMEKRRASSDLNEVESDAIKLLVDNVHSIPIGKVVQQLQQRPYYLFLYLDALMHKDAQLVTEFTDLQVEMYAEFATARLIDFLRASSSYNLEKAYKECQERDLVPEMVFLLGRMGNNKKALTLDFSKEQNDDHLWEDLLKYS